MSEEMQVVFNTLNGPSPSVLLQGTHQLPLLDNVAIPEGLRVIVTDEADSFLHLRGQLNSSTPQFFGTAYRQGNRLHFSTAMSVRDYEKLVAVDQAEKGSTLEQASEHSNRPSEKSHAKAIGQYLDETACQGLPFIFPSFMLNFGVDWTDDKPQAELIIYRGSRDAMAWPAIFTPPVSGGMHVTDGGHRTDQIKKKLGAAAGKLPENALSVIFVMESAKEMYHQDFADCAKAKAISKSLAGSWDRRDVQKKFGIELVEMNLPLRKFVDATSNSVNLSTNSSKCWSMSAVQAAVGSLHAEGRPNNLSAFIDKCFAEIPILADIANGISSPAKFRNAGRGGCVLLRGVGFAVLIQAYQHAAWLGNNISPEEMAKKLGTIDWYVLKQGAPPQTQDAHTYTTIWAQDIWVNMLAMMAGASAFRIKGTHDAAKVSFEKICRQLGI